MKTSVNTSENHLASLYPSISRNPGFFGSNEGLGTFLVRPQWALPDDAIHPAMGHALHLWLVSGLVHRTVRTVNGEVSRRFLQGDTITVTETIATTTITSTIDPCIGAQDACACAAGLICGWSAFANGGGICQNRGEPTNIDCFICGAQEKCPKNCPQLTSACECAASAGCAWDLGFGQCVVSTASTDCRACSTQAGCDVNPPVLVESGYSPANGGAFWGESRTEVLKAGPLSMQFLLLCLF